jgi:hypothetical protein
MMSVHRNLDLKWCHCSVRPSHCLVNLIRKLMGMYLLDLERLLRLYSQKLPLAFLSQKYRHC